MSEPQARALTLPDELPLDWDEWRRWKRRWDERGLREALYEKCYAGARSKNAFARELAAWTSNSENSEVTGGDALKVGTAIQYLHSYFRYEEGGELEPRHFEALCATLGIAQDELGPLLAERPALDLEISRSHWLNALPAIRFKKREMVWHDLLPRTVDRRISAFACTWPHFDFAETDGYQVGQGSALLLSVRGSVQVQLYGLSPFKFVVPEGMGLLLNRQVPHRVVPLSEGAVLLDISASSQCPGPSVPSFAPYSPRLLHKGGLIGAMVSDQAPEGTAPLREAAPHLVSFALTSSGRSTAELVELLGSNKQRVLYLISGKAKPALREIEAVARICRIPVETFTRPAGNWLFPLMLQPLFGTRFVVTDGTKLEVTVSPDTPPSGQPPTLSPPTFNPDVAHPLVAVLAQVDSGLNTRPSSEALTIVTHGHGTLSARSFASNAEVPAATSGYFRQGDSLWTRQAEVSFDRKILEGFDMRLVEGKRKKMSILTDELRVVHCAVGLAPHQSS